MGILGDLTAAEILEQVVYSKLAPSKLRQVVQQTALMTRFL
jgi:hypothetical protein